VSRTFRVLPLLCALAGHAAAQGAPASSGGSPSFCPFELPADVAESPRRLINLAIVQYVEITADAFRIYYGGGNLGSGHEARIAIASREEGASWLQRMSERAMACR
jgi:hypothetical protein